jgi:hypothetical protein
LAALSQRREYVCISTEDPYPGSGALALLHASRVGETKQVLKATTAAELREFRRRTGIRWFVLHPDTEAGWPTSVVRGPRMESFGFRLFDLTLIDDQAP